MCTFGPKVLEKIDEFSRIRRFVSRMSTPLFASDGLRIFRVHADDKIALFGIEAPLFSSRPLVPRKYRLDVSGLVNAFSLLKTLAGSENSLEARKFTPTGP